MMPTRQRFDRPGLPRVVRVHPESGAPLVFGPFPTAAAALNFVDTHRIREYGIDIVYPPTDANPPEQEKPA
jgi:hypothetical protein